MRFQKMIELICQLDFLEMEANRFEHENLIQKFYFKNNDRYSIKVFNRLPGNSIRFYIWDDLNDKYMHVKFERFLGMASEELVIKLLYHLDIFRFAE